MKTIKKLVMGTMFLVFFGNALNAAPQETAIEFKPDIEDIRVVQEQVRKFLNNKNYNLKGTVDVNVVLYLNDDNEIEILSVGTKDENLKQFLMKNLNTKRFADDVDRRGYTYICPMRIRGIS